jgi:hypothetical protein
MSLYRYAQSKRVWVVQEAAYAAKSVFHLGIISCSWVYLASIIKMPRSSDADLLLWAHGEYIAGWIIELIICEKLTQRVVQETAKLAFSCSTYSEDLKT